MSEYVPDNYDIWLLYDTESEKEWSKILRQEQDKESNGNGS